jgi:transmembrane sensor
MSDRFRHLPDPVGDALAGSNDDVRIERAYRRLRQPRARSVALRPIALAAVALAVALVAFFAGRFTAPEGAPVARAPAPVRTADGHPLARIDSGRVALDDGSSIAVGEGSLVETVRNDGREVALALVRGRVELEVEPGGPRAWSIDCGIATVSVVGTSFTLERTSSSLRVDVRHGVVSVRGAAVPDGMRFVRAGESLVVGREPSVEEPSEPIAHAVEAAPEVTPAEPPPREAVAREENAPSIAAPGWRELADRGAWAEAYDALGADGVARQMRSANAEELLVLADVARRSGHPQEAIAPLERLIASHRGAEAALGAFTLGRLASDQLGDPARAAVAFERALGDELPASLVPDALARLATAQASSGAVDRAALTASRYLSQYPNGPQRAAMEAIVSGSPR